MKPRIHFDESPTFGRSACYATMQLSVLGLAGHGQNRQEALASLRRRALEYQELISRGLEVIEEAEKAQQK